MPGVKVRARLELEKRWGGARDANESEKEEGGEAKKKTIEGTACLVRNEKGALFFLCPLKLTLRLAWQQREEREKVSLVKGKACAGGASLSGVGCECGVFFHSIDRPRERERE